MKRVLNLGCGTGRLPRNAKLSNPERVVGIDVDVQRLKAGKQSFPHYAFLAAQSEKLPFADASFDAVVSAIALPYMGIPKALSESHRVLGSDGELFASLHSYRFTLSEFRNAGISPRALLYRAWVLLNGLLFHVTGRNVGECFQTRRGMTKALGLAGFDRIQFDEDGTRWFVTARKKESTTKEGRRGPAELVTLVPYNVSDTPDSRSGTRLEIFGGRPSGRTQQWQNRVVRSTWATLTRVPASKRA